ncbi:bifunctional epoxide hydrolase 2 [Canna indica]|uniref:soluble epoxide hydrolase n=1 Tax=Canna indica TaxID=4628 RepID=A0AAQ3KG17_9LILI|nr:bifunctional epoxide hydrolase 2 [Canna indica]
MLRCARALCSRLPRGRRAFASSSPSTQLPMDGGDGAGDGIAHRTVAVNGINMHVAEKGEGPAVLLLHGFPELWYTWRHQMHGLAASGYRVVAPDLRGFGDTDAPTDTAAYSMLHIVGDLIALLNTLGQDQVFVVGHDWGSMVAWNLSMLRPDKVKAMVSLSQVFTPRNPMRKPLQYLKSVFGDDYYIVRFQEPGKIEEEFARFGTAWVLRKFLTYHNPGPFYITKDQGWVLPAPEIPLPSWLSEADIKYYTSKYEKTGFTGALNYYRCLDLNWELTAPWTEARIKVPVKFIVGDQDLTYHSPGTQDFIHKGGLKKYVPLLEEAVVMEGVGHFINEEKPDEITKHIYNFIKKF